MVEILVDFNTVNGIANAVFNVIYTSDSIIASDNPDYTFVSVDSYNEDGEVEIGGMFYNILYTKDNGIGGLVFDVNLQNYYLGVEAQTTGISDNAAEGDQFIDDDFFGLTEAQALALIYPTFENRERLTLETYPAWPLLRDALSPNNEECLFIGFRYDNGVLHLDAKTFSGITYVGAYDIANVGTEWSGWRQAGGSRNYVTSIPRGASQIYTDILTSNNVIVKLDRAGDIGTGTLTRVTSNNNVYITYGNNTAVVNVNFTTGNVTLVSTGTDNGTVITGITLV